MAIAAIAWVLLFMIPMAVAGDRYVIGYTLVLGAILLAIRAPVARRLRDSRIPHVVSFLGASAILCAIEVWFRMPLGSRDFVPSFLVLFGWCVGVYIVARRIRLAMMELWIVTGLAGWFQEGVIFHRFGLLSPVAAIVLAWSVWAYAMLVLIPVSIVPGPAPPAVTGRAWRYPLAFAIPIAVMLGFLIVGGALKAVL